MRAWRSLRFRLILSYIILAFILLSFVGYVFSNALSAYAVSVQDSQKNQVMKQALTILSEAKKSNLSPDDTLALLKQNLPDINIEQVASNPLLNLTPPKLDEEDFDPGDGSRLTTKLLIISSTKLNNSSFTLQNPADNPKTSSVFYQFTLRPSAFNVLAKIYRNVLEILVLTLVLAGIIGWLFSRWLGKPLSRLAAATKLVAGGNFQETVSPSGIIELDQVVEQFNKMVLQLRESFVSLAAERDTAQRFAADAAHELKTPVATLRAYQDVISEHPERLNQSLPAIGRQIERMEQIISGLLQIATLDQGNDFALQTLDLGRFIGQLKPNYEALAAENDHVLTLTLPDIPVDTTLNPRLLELALDNLMANAFKYTPHGGKVSLTLLTNNQEILIILKDSGKGIPEQELPFIFDRFRRGIDTQAIPGSGLGLAIVHEALKRINGTISVESQVDIGTQFIIRLPFQPT